MTHFFLHLWCHGVNYVDSNGLVWHPSRMLTLPQFHTYLTRRRARGESLRIVGESLGVTKQAVFQWLTGVSRPSDTVLLLAEMLDRSPVDLPAGLPGAELSDGS